MRLVYAAFEEKRVRVRCSPQSETSENHRMEYIPVVILLPERHDLMFPACRGTTLLREDWCVTGLNDYSGRWISVDECTATYQSKALAVHAAIPYCHHPVPALCPHQRWHLLET